MNLELRNHIWYVTVLVPEDVRKALGRVRFKQSLGTSNRHAAELLKAPYLAQWKAQIRQARATLNPLQSEAVGWRRDIENAIDADVKFVIEDHLVERTKKIEKEDGPARADDFFGIATGTRTLSNSYFEQWKAQLDLAAKTKDQMIKDVTQLTARFSSIEEITKKAVKHWMEDLDKQGKGNASQKRILSFCRNYWKYLQSHDAVPVDHDPFFGVLNLSKTKKKASTGGSWVPFKADEVVALWNAAGAKEDKQLQDLIMLGAYTGSRIEELCSLKVANVTKTAFKITDAKTAAGIREVPIHSALIALVKRLKDETKDEYLISGLSFNKYDDRSNAIGKRFGRLKADAGYSSAHVFHSIRKTFVTLLENAGVSENVTADIVGHEKPRLTYGLYSGGNQLEIMREAIDKAKYPFPA